MSVLASPSARDAWRRGVPATFAVHVAQTTLAVLLASWWGEALIGAWAGHADGARALVHGGGILVETLHGLTDGWAARALLRTLPLLLAWWLLGVPLQLWWIAEMRAGTSRRETLVGALRRVPAALATSLVWGATAGAALTLALAPPILWRLALASTPDPRWADLGGLVAALPALLVALTAGAWHDTARAAVVLGHGPMQALTVAWRARRTRAYAGWTLAAGVLTAAASLLPSGWTLLAGQALLLAARYARAAWVATALTSVTRSTGEPASPGERPRPSEPAA